MATLLDKIRYLHPDVKCCVWDTEDESQYMGENVPIHLDNSLVDWSALNPYPCPSQEELDALDNSVVDGEIFSRSELLRKQIRDDNAKSNLGILSGFRAEKKLIP